MNQVLLSADGFFTGNISQGEDPGFHVSGFVSLLQKRRDSETNWIGLVDHQSYDDNKNTWHIAGRVIGATGSMHGDPINSFTSPDPSCTGGAWIDSITDERVLGALALYLTGFPGIQVGWLARRKTPKYQPKLPLKKMNRHTAVFGQSGSGKTNTLAVLIEELHFNANADIVILDPNGDFASMAEELRKPENDKVISALGDAPKEVWTNRMQSYSKTHHEQEMQKDTLVQKRTSSIREITVHTAPSFLDKDMPGVRPSDFALPELACILGIDPQADATEFDSLRQMYKRLSDPSRKTTTFAWQECEKDLQAQKSDGANRVMRICENQGLAEHELWHHKSLTDSIMIMNTQNPHTVVADISGLTRVNQAIITIAVCRAVWQLQRARKDQLLRGNKHPYCRPTYLVVDEAHNVFPASVVEPYEALCRQWGIRVAAEGRKFGVYLLLCSQLPSKVPAQILSESGNLVLMRMVSDTDIRMISTCLSYANEDLLAASKSLTRGEGLFLGDFAKAPVVLECVARVTREMGSDFETEALPSHTGDAAASESRATTPGAEQ